MQKNSNPAIPWPVILFLALILVSLASPVVAQDAILIVPRRAESLTIPSDWLSGNPQSSLQSLVEPSRGVLEHSGDGLLYWPDREFREMGLDHFQYVRQNALAIQREAYLVADLRENLWTDGPLDPDCNLQAGWSIVGNVGRSEGVLDDDPCIAEIDLSQPSYLGFEVPILPADSGPGGGNTGMGLDPGPYVEADEVVVLVALNEAQQPIFEVVLSELELSVRARQGDGSFATSAPVPLNANAGIVALDLGWWLAHHAESQDGGFWLTLDGELRGQVLGLDNHGPEFFPHEWRFGNVGGPPNLEGILEIGEVDIWESPRGPVFAPLFADGGETGDLGRWSALINPQNLAVVEEAGEPGFEVRIFGGPGGGSGGGLVDTSPAGLRGYQARFLLDTEPLSLPPKAWMTIFQATDPTQATVFRVDLTMASDGSGYQVRAVGRDGEGLVLGPWVPLPALDQIPLGIRWWAGEAPRYGGLILEVPLAQDQEMILPPWSGILDRTVLGALEIQGALSVSTVLRVDDFEAWH